MPLSRPVYPARKQSKREPSYDGNETNKQDSNSVATAQSTSLAFPKPGYHVEPAATPYFSVGVRPHGMASMAMQFWRRRTFGETGIGRLVV